MSVNYYAQDSFWEKTDGPNGGVIYSILNQNDTLYISGKSGVFISYDLGVSWSSIGLESYSVYELVSCNNYLIVNASGGCYRKKITETDWIKVINGNFQTIVAKDSMVYLGSGYDGVYRSNDCGQNWEQINNGIDNRDIEKIYITASNVVLASAAGTSGSAIFRSLDFGDSWTRIDPYLYAWNFQGITELNNILYGYDFVNNAKVYKSTDDGLTWVLPSNSSAPSDRINSIYADNDGIYVSVDHYGFFRSYNEGASWSKINYGLQNLTITDIKGNKDELFLATFDGFYKSTKSSMNWKRHMDGINNLEIYSISQNADYVFVGSSGSGLFRAKKDLSNWEVMNLGNNNKFITSVLAFENNVFVLVSSWSNHYYQELYVSSNNGTSWKKLNPNFDSAQLKTIVGNNNVLFIGSGYGVFRSTNMGNSWEKMLNGMPYNVNSTSIAVYDSVVIVTNGTSDIYRSENLGASWNSNYVEDLNSGTTVEVSEDGNFYLGSGSINRLFKSEDSGKTWNKLNNHLYNSAVNSISIKGSKIYCGLSNDGVLKSSDGGASWTQNNSGLVSKQVKCISVFDNEIIVGTKSGLYYETTSEINPIVDYPEQLTNNYLVLRWKRSHNIDLYRIQVSTDPYCQTTFVDQVVNDTSFALQSLDFMTTYYWRISTVTDIWDNKFSAIQKIVVTNPNNYKLYNNYPNPFNNETNIRVDIPYRSKIELVLYNVIGEKVKTIDYTFKDAGSHYYKIESNGLSSGVYFLRLVGNSFSQTVKLVILR